MRRRYRRGDLHGARLAIAATDDPAVNQSVCTEAKRRNLLVNCITSPNAGNFLVPSLVRRGGISLAISTGGASPAFAKRLRVDLEHFLGDEYPLLLKAMSAARRAKKA
jgi:precorrin-2 dehydrogenase/sirohydrochlorin ferrochelatase